MFPPHPESTHLVLRVHLGHHPVFQEVEGEHLQDVKLMRHLIVDGPLRADDVLGKWFTSDTLKQERRTKEKSDNSVSSLP